jgi:hypothetical protein
MDKDYNNIPANACTFRGAVEIRDNGDGSTTAPISLLARSSQPIEHWYWGNVVHDLSGAFGKDRITLDYNHGEEIGYSNKREIREDGLHLSGALVSVKEDDTAHTVMKRAHAGIPYEASINFGGDGIKVEEVREGQPLKSTATSSQGQVLSSENGRCADAPCVLMVLMVTPSQIFFHRALILAPK